jgi:hypothetical protein
LDVVQVRLRTDMSFPPVFQAAFNQATNAGAEIGRLGPPPASQ